MKPGKMKLLNVAIGLALFGASSAMAEVSFSSDDGKFSTTLGGRIQVDGAWYDEDNVDLDGESGTEFRRARLFVKGTMYDVWNYKAQYDFAGNGTEIKDAYIGYKGWDFADLKIGQFKQPAGLEELTSSKYITFMERAMASSAFATSRRIGAGLSNAYDHWTWAASVYGNEEDGDDNGGDESYGAGARVTWAPWNESGKVIHLGLWGAAENPNDEDIRIRARPESHKTNTRFVNTGKLMDADSIIKGGIEGAAVFGPFSVQGEYMAAEVDSGKLSSGMDAGDPSFDGGYIYGSWFITGESRKYKKGKFDRVTPNSTAGRGGIGAWEVAARYSKLNLEDAKVDGGEAENITVGVNWYATKYVRFMANYVYVDADPMSSECSECVASGKDDDNPSVFQVRAQIDF